MEIPEDINVAKDVIQSLVKAKKIIRLYPENNPIYAKTIEENFSKFADFFNYRDELTLKITQNEMLLDSVQVYHNPETEDNLALFFFRDGLRELSFKKGLSREELEEFLKTITLDFDREDSEDDIVTLLWEKDFQNIKYIVDEISLMEDEDYESKAVAEIKSKAPGDDAFLEAYTDALNAKDIGDIPIVNLTDKDIQLLVKEIERDQSDKTREFSEILFKMLLNAESQAEYEDAYCFFKDTIVHCLKHGDLKVFVDILKRAKGIGESPTISENIKNQIARLLRVANSDESIRYIGEIFDSNIDKNILNEYIRFLDKNAIPLFISLLGERDTISARKKVISILIQLGKDDIQAIASALHDTRWYVVRNIVYILRQIGDEGVVEYILNTVRHEDARVRKEAIKALGELKNPLALRALRECLNDTDITIKKSAVRAIAAIGSETAKRMLLERVSEKSFRDRDFDEKKEFFEVLAQWNDPDVVDFMMRILKKRSFFKRARSDENRACAAHSLGLMGNKDALPALYKLKDSRNKLLRDSVNTAIKKIEDDR
mgnify:FL=1